MNENHHSKTRRLIQSINQSTAPLKINSGERLNLERLKTLNDRLKEAVRKTTSLIKEVEAHYAKDQSHAAKEKPKATIGRKSTLLLIGCLLFLLVGCISNRQILTEPTGIVLEVYGNTYMVASKVVNKGDPGSQLIQWVYEENHTYKKGDHWPRCSHKL